MADIFTKKSLEDQQAANEQSARERLQTLKDRATPKESPLFGMRWRNASTAEFGQVGTKTEDPPISLWEAGRREARITEELRQKNASAEQNASLSEAQKETEYLLNQIDSDQDGKSPAGPLAPRFADALSQGGKAFTDITNKIITDVRANPILGPSIADKLSRNFFTLAQAQLQTRGSQWLSNIPTISADEARRRGLPADQALTSRAEAGQPVFVGSRDYVAQLGRSTPVSTVPTAPPPTTGSPGPGVMASLSEGPMSFGTPRPGPANLGPTTAPQVPKTHHDHIADIARDAMKHLAKGATGSAGPAAMMTPSAPTMGGADRMAQAQARAAELRSQGLSPQEISAQLQQEFPGLG